MNKTILLLNLKNKILYKRAIDKIIVLLMIGFIVGLMLIYWQSSNNTIRVYITNQDQSELVNGFLKSSSRQLEIHEVSKKEGINKIKNYQAELLIVIPPNSSNKIHRGETKNIFELYYLKGNQLAGLIADRLIADAFSEIYKIVGDALTQDLYRRYEVNNSMDKINDFRQNVLKLRSKIRKEQYFEILYQLDLKSSNQNSLDQFHNNRSSSPSNNFIEFGILVVVSGINFIFLLYFGLKLLYQADKNVRIRLAGFNRWHIAISNFLVMLFPQLLLFLMLCLFSLYYSSFTFMIIWAIISLIELFINLIFIAIIKEKSLYFPMGIGIYLVGVIVGIIFLKS